MHLKIVLHMGVAQHLSCIVKQNWIKIDKKNVIKVYYCIVFLYKYMPVLTMSAKQYFDIYKSSAYYYYYYYYLHMYTKHKQNKKTIANKTKANTNLAAYLIFADICELRTIFISLLPP